MKKLILFSLISFLLYGCKKEMPEPLTNTSVNNGFGPTFNEYYITFFSNNFNSSGAIPVSVNGGSGLITYAFNYNPGCGAMGCANFTLPPGTYTYTGGLAPVKSGTIITGGSQCITIMLR